MWRYLRFTDERKENNTSQRTFRHSNNIRTEYNENPFKTVLFLYCVIVYFIGLPMDINNDVSRSRRQTA